MKNLRGVVLGVLVLLVGSISTGAQEFSGVKGMVVDKSSAPVAGVEVTLDNQKTGLHLKTTTNDQGEYQFLRVAPGPGYALAFAKEGFAKLEMMDVYLGVNATSTRNATLEIGAITQSVEVKATGEQTLDTTDATIGNVFGTDVLHSLPIEFRDSPAALLGLQPGVVLAGSNDPSGNREGSVTGARADQGNITVDGIDANDQATGQAFATVGNAPIDAVQEFRGITAGITADMGRSSGAQIQIVSKPGSNDWHGSAYEYHRNTITAANSFFNNASGVPRAALIRNQFGGSLGGPVKRDKLFFFFNYEGRRDASQENIARTVPLDHFRNGQLGYINNGNDTQGFPCTAGARLNDPVTAQCISFTPATGPNSLASLDPAGTGADAALVTFVSGRYPEANDLTGGDGINTGLLRFNAPVHLGNNTYWTRIDYNLSDKQRLFGRFNIVRSSQTDDINFSAVQFPGDPAPAHEITDRDYAFVIGHTWTVSSEKINQATFGITASRLGFPSLAQTTFPNSYSIGGVGGNPFMSAPFSSLQSQFRTVPVPTLRDDFTWTRGKHVWQFGGLFKPSHQTSRQINDFNFPTLGLGGLTTSLDSTSRNLRPSDILQDPAAIGEWDSTFPFILGRFAQVSTNFNYTRNGNPQNPGSGRTRNYRYFEYEFYGQDQWHMTNSLTITYGLRWQYYSVPYETAGLQSVPTVDFPQILAAREQAGASGLSGSNVVPVVQYVLGGKANSSAPSIYNPDYRNFSPRFSLAYNPSFREGPLGGLIGDRKTSVRLGGTVVYDRVNANTINFIQDQVSYLFNNNVNTPFGGGDPGVTLATDPRFTALGTLPVTNVAPPITTPFTPFVDPASGYLLGNAEGQFNYAIEKNFRTPLSYVYNLGVQRELPRNFLLEVNYVGRLGRRLFAQSDASQLVDFLDPASRQGLVDAFNQLSAQVRAGTPGALITTQPWFENQMDSAIQTNFGLANCQQFTAAVFGANIPTCTRLVRALFSTLLRRGDLTDTLQALYGFFPGPFGGVIPQNVGLGGQFSVNSYITNAGSSDYDAMLVTLTKRYSGGLQFQFNYSLGHSIDNVSTVTNTVIGGLVCDVRNLRVCRGNSDFDVTHVINANGVYDLPFGKGRRFAAQAHGVLNQIIGGWQFGTIATWHTGFAFSTSTDAFPVNFFVNSPAILTGSASALATNIHSDSTGAIQMFSNPTAALGAYSFTNGGQVGSRNTLRGPSFWNFDTRFAKQFPLTEAHKLTFQWDAFNAFNHTNFADPAADINSPATFGQITSQANANRVMQFSLRYDF
ncbi:MAG TPA: TonB-dependent receptor [Candidatus Acidoferrum sp.]|nr:TonB-dependent receptor [Candidatus Acidoferrum sp.]